MILIDLAGDEAHPVYEELQISNNSRQYDFLLSIIKASIDIQRPFLSAQLMKALNFHAIACLHISAGEYRPCGVEVGKDANKYTPPAPYRVPALMDDFINYVNYAWSTSDPLVLGAFVLWRLNHIHPFINGNGRTARAICYYVICARIGGLLPGTTMLPALLKRDRPDYVDALKKVDKSLETTLDLTPLTELIQKLINEQLASDGQPNSP
ncbi:MAG: Fic family protein [Pseudomonadota bacterium]